MALHKLLPASVQPPCRATPPRPRTSTAAQRGQRPSRLATLAAGMIGLSLALGLHTRASSSQNIRLDKLKLRSWARGRGCRFSKRVRTQKTTVFDIAIESKGFSDVGISHCCLYLSALSLSLFLPYLFFLRGTRSVGATINASLRSLYLSSFCSLSSSTAASPSMPSPGTHRLEHHSVAA